MKAVISIQDLNNLQVAQLGRSAYLKFFSITPSTGATELFTLHGGWCLWRKDRDRAEKSGAVTIVISKQAVIDVERLRDNAVVELYAQERTRRYQVVEITETQDITSGWVVHGEPLQGSI